MAIADHDARFVATAVIRYDTSQGAKAVATTWDRRADQAPEASAFARRLSRPSR
jgi:hypothetical protein